MMIDPKAAAIFIDGYSRLLRHVFDTHGGNPAKPKLHVLADGRAAIAANPSLLSQAARELDAAGTPVLPAVLKAVETSRVGQWIYLRDTTRYSVFINGEGTHAYAVLGLTQPIWSIVGGDGVFIETALMEYHHHVIIDGIISGVVWLGPNYRKGYSRALAEAKKLGKFHTTTMGGI